MSTEEQPPDQVRILAEVSEAMIALYEAEFGRGPSAAQTHWCGPDAVSCFLEGTLTPTERNLVEVGQHADVRDRRSLWQYATVTEFCRPVERIMERTVRSFHSSIDTHVEGLSTETFLFYPAGREGPSRGDGSTHLIDGVPWHGASHADAAARSAAPPAMDEELTPAERASTELVRRLVSTGNLRPLVQAMRDGEQGPEDARVVLATLGELDRDRLVQIALDSLINEYVDGDGDGQGSAGS